MKVKYATLPAIAVMAFAAYVGFHPGIAYSEPQISSAVATSRIQDTATYNIDPMHTSIYFEISHMGLANVHGRINKFSGTIREDATDPTRSSVQFTAQTETIDTNVAPRDTHLKSADFFDVAKYPTITFKSTSLRSTPTGYIVNGDLTIKDVTKPISIAFRRYGVLKTQDQPDRVGYVAEPLRINRRDFNINYGQNLPNGNAAIGDTVTIRINVEATKA